jgi:hypothetical protein
MHQRYRSRNRCPTLLTDHELESPPLDHELGGPGAHELAVYVEGRHSGHLDLGVAAARVAYPTPTA